MKLKMSVYECMRGGRYERSLLESQVISKIINNQIALQMMPRPCDMAFLRHSLRQIMIGRLWHWHCKPLVLRNGHALTVSRFGYVIDSSC